MFGLGKKKPPPIRSLIGEGTVIQGTLRFSDGLRIDGEIQGDVVATANDTSILVISEKARVQGKVKAGHVIINGSVVGPVHSTALLELQPKASIVGDVSYEALEMHQGATIDGELRPIKAGEKVVLFYNSANRDEVFAVFNRKLVLIALALAADQVWAHQGVVLNPHYKNMGNLYGSEYWTCLLPRRVRSPLERSLGTSPR